MDWKTMLSYISGSVDEELLLRNEYLVAENRVLRNQLQGLLPQLSVGEMTLRLYGALDYSRNSVRDLRFALNGA